MSGSIVALLIGLILLVVAVWLLKHASSQGESGGAAAARQSVPPASSLPDPDSTDDDGDANGAASTAGAVPGAADGGGSADERADRAGEGAVASPVGEQAQPEDAPELPPEDAQAPEEGPDMVAAETAQGGLFVSIRRRRRQWAAANGAEFTREDLDLPQEWPIAALHAVSVSPIRALAKDVVSGFWEGHEYHVADLGEGTLMAMRRAAASPVTVHYSREQGVTEGLRRSELLDQPPYAAYTSDVRALDRMLDVRVEDSLAALSQVASDVIWGGDWVILSISRKLDFSIWLRILPELLSLAHAAMVLPPRTMSVVLELENADQTRALPGTAVSLSPAGAESADCQQGEGALQEKIGRGRGEENASPAGERKSRPGYLRPVGQTPAAPVEAGESGEAAVPPSSVSDAAEVYAGQESDESTFSDRPHIERPANPVEFPSRFDRGREADPADDFSDSVLEMDSENIPLIGEDPDHISASVGQRPQVIRADIERAPTIFSDELSATAAERRGQRRRSGRHRAPDARHALPSPIEPVEAEIELVEAEIVEPGDDEDWRSEGR
ncbi:hypothetical protein [Corynebacterium sp. HMSC27B11]|uniref:hypothetical protein n=1 Tax=Corynebacterium sp. HMSC27B11 TaxID=1581065 RepID=UPI0008A2313A|nr:hypothetical protein [Corynebacterium sp. HMSC27B11]OFS18409.1 hypothetical protein HMPREF3097_01465 [Corynebacterium sp. HMSC27B11]